MNKTVAVIGVVIIVNACTWGFAMIMSAHTLAGTGAYQQIQNILAGCAVASLIVVGGGFGGLLLNLKQGRQEPDAGRG